MKSLRKSFSRIALVALATITPAMASLAEEPAAKPPIVLTDEARKLHAETLLIDGHNDLPWELRQQARGQFDKLDISKEQKSLQTDIPKLRKGGVGAQFWSVWVPGETSKRGAALSTTIEQIELVKAMIAQYPDTFELALTADDIERIAKTGRIASLIGVEGGYSIEESIPVLRQLYALGARYMTLTHSDSLAWADSGTDKPRSGGLSPFGEEVVREMNRLGMMVDISHVSPDAMKAALRITKAPVIFSHSSARALCDVPRNVPDSILKRLPENGGVVMVTFVAGFIDPEVAKIQVTAMAEAGRRAQGKSVEEGDKIFEEVMGNLKLPKTSIAKVADHIEHIRNVAGVEHIGLGGDYDGNTAWPVGLEDVSSYPLLFAELIRRGWSDEDLTLLAGENVLRALAKAEDVSRELNKKK